MVTIACAKVILFPQICHFPTHFLPISLPWGGFTCFLVVSRQKACFWFSPSDWSGGLEPEFEGDISKFSVVMPEGIGGDQWQGQCHLRFDDVKLSASKKYDLSLVVVSDGEIPGMTVKAQLETDDNVFLTADRHDVPANIPTAITQTDLQGFDGQFRLCLDFGGTAAGTKVTVYGVYVGEHK